MSESVTEPPIPWKLWVKHQCPTCGLTGEGRYRRMMQGINRCPACGSRFDMVGDPFPIEGSDLDGKGKPVMMADSAVDEVPDIGTFGWDHVRIEPSEVETGYADMFLMNESGRAADIIIAHLPLQGEPSRVSVSADPDWQLILDALAEISTRTGAAWLPIETSNGDVWIHGST